MNSSTSSRQPADPGAIEFEFIDLAEARKAMEDLPAGIESIHTLAPGYWLTRRRRPEVTDRALTGIAIDWMMGLPPELRPLAASQGFPRITNRIAAAWARADECETLLVGLLNDKRTGRLGFPTAVRAELEALRSALASTGPDGAH